VQEAGRSRSRSSITASRWKSATSETSAGYTTSDGEPALTSGGRSKLGSEEQALSAILVPVALNQVERLNLEIRHQSLVAERNYEQVTFEHLVHRAQAA